ncbi:MAG: hypothetical protein M3174_00635 [Actinomycetota bacterium]|nr:hypothetical protein [Actinomycetota bacterium]
MAEADALDLESTIKQLPGVLGCVILTNPESGAPEEIQAFIRSGFDRVKTQHSIYDEAFNHGVHESLRQVLVFELQAESHISDRESLQRAAEVAEQEVRARGRTTPPAPPGEGGAEPAASEPPPPPPLESRPQIGRVLLSSTVWRSEAEVSLGPEGEQVTGQATGEKTPHGLGVLAQATLDAASRLAGGLSMELKGASLVNTFGREVVLVVVQVGEGAETVGAALVRDGPVTEAAVRATLDALNRRISQGG